MRVLNNQEMAQVSGGLLGLNLNLQVKASVNLGLDSKSYGSHSQAGVGAHVGVKADLNLNSLGGHHSGYRGHGYGRGLLG